MGLTDFLGGASPWGAGMQVAGGLINGISRLFLARKQRSLADSINPVRTYYQISPYAKQNQALALNAMNAQMPGAASAEQGINTSMANTINAGQRNATSSADALALAAGAQGTANRAYDNLATQEGQYAQNQLSNVMGANRDLTGEADKVFQDKLQDYQEKLNTKNSLLGASLQNKYGAFGDFGNGLMMAGNAINQRKLDRPR